MSQNLVWPADPSYHNPITLISNEKKYNVFNFELHNHDKTDLACDGYKNMKNSKIDPDCVEKA